jgi:hypothetical protein
MAGTAAEQIITVSVLDDPNALRPIIRFDDDVSRYSTIGAG